MGTDKIDINFANYKKIKIYTTNNNLSSSVAELGIKLYNHLEISKIVTEIKNLNGLDNMGI